MRDARTYSGVWTRDAQVYVEGDPDVQADRSAWTTVAVLEVHPIGVAFRIGWRTEEFVPAEFYSVAAETMLGRMGMYVGDKGVWFVARPLDGRTEMTMVLVDRVKDTDPSYQCLPHY